ncbi:MAG: hypothetical protein ACK5PP_19770 [Acidimicrobiales bacterium]
MKHRLVGFAAGLLLIVASLGGGFTSPADAAINCPAEKRHSTIWGLPSEGVRAWCWSSTGGKLVRGHHHNWGRDLTTPWFNVLNYAYSSATSTRSGWAGLDVS